MAPLIELIIQDQKRRHPRFKVKKAPRQLYPFGIQRRYTRELNKIVSDAINLTREIVYPALPVIEQQAEFNRPREDRFDDYTDTITETMRSTRLSFDNLHNEQEYQSIAEVVGNSTSDFNREQLQKVFKKMIGVNIVFDEPWLNQELNAFVKSNVELIKTIPRDFFEEIEGIMTRGARAGIRHEEIRKEIVSRFGVTRNRAKLIARDQINKFNGQLTKLRQESVGVSSYIWRTAGDERVRGNPGGRFPSARPSHFSRDGEEFEWSQPPEGGHPGEAIQCRCWPEPVLDDFL